MARYLLQHYLEETVTRFPHKIAIRCGDSHITYEELWKRSVRLALFLNKKGVREGELVSIYMNKSIEAIICMYGVLMVGGVYIPLDAHYSPVDRIGGMIRQSGSSLVITNQTLLQSIHSVMPQDIIEQDMTYITILSGSEKVNKNDVNMVSHDVFSMLDEDTTQNQQVNITTTNTDLAYILYTSGSMGIPKGVMLTHLNAMTFIEWAISYFRPTHQWNFANVAPLHFDLSVFDLYVSVACGGCLNLVPTHIVNNPRGIVKWIHDNRINCMYSVPSLWIAILRYADVEIQDLRYVKRVLFAGEIFPPNYLKKLMNVLPHANFYNLYGPTETNVCTCYSIPDDSVVQNRPVPIGKACANTEVIVLNNKGELASVGEEGELFVKGSIVMRGYHNQPEVTAKSFINSPIPSHQGLPLYRTGDIVRLNEDGDYEYIGRRDNMVKSNGFRIELSEIECALLEINTINEAVVVTIRDDESGINHIYAVVQMSQKASFSVIRIKNDLAQYLPKYMLPTYIVLIDEIPKNANNKTDRQQVIKWLYDKI